MDPQFTGLWKSHGIAKWVSGLVLASALVAIGWLAAMEESVFWPKPKVVTVVDKVRGKILVEANEKVGNIGRQLLAEGKTKVICETGDRHDLVEGLSELPVGKYQIVYDGPDEFEQEGHGFEVYATGTTRLSLSPILTKQFQYPARYAEDRLGSEKPKLPQGKPAECLVARV